MASTIYHAHVYFDRRTRRTAASVRGGLVSRFAVDCRWRSRPVGPHSKPNFRARFSRAQRWRIVRWLKRHREGLSVLVHPYSADNVADHTDRALWLGKPVRLDLAYLGRLTRGDRAARRKPRRTRSARS